MDDPTLGEEWKPERCGFVLRFNDAGIWINSDDANPKAWRAEPFYSQIKAWSATARFGTGCVVVYEGERIYVVFPEQEVEVFGLALGMSVSAMYRRASGFRQPIALVRDRRGRIQEFAGARFPETFF